MPKRYSAERSSAETLVPKRSHSSSRLLRKSDVDFLATKYSKFVHFSGHRDRAGSTAVCPWLITATSCSSLILCALLANRLVNVSRWSCGMQTSATGRTARTITRIRAKAVVVFHHKHFFVFLVVVAGKGVVNDHGGGQYSEEIRLLSGDPLSGLIPRGGSAHCTKPVGASLPSRPQCSGIRWIISWAPPAGKSRSNSCRISAIAPPMLL